MIFDKDWFNKYQSIFLWLLNNKFTRRWFRWVLRIRQHDAGYNREIVSLQPNHYTAIYNDTQLISDFRTHDKYAKRLYYAFYPIWLAMHIWDLVADTLVPSLSFGFATLTSFPDAGDPGSTSVDGQVRRVAVNEAWATLIAGAGTQAFSTSNPAPAFNITSGTISWNQVTRTIYLFNTASLGADISIVTATLSLFGSSKSDGLVVTPNCDIYTSTPASNTTLAASDYGNIGSTSQTGAPVAYASLSITAYVDFPFNLTGVGNISKTSISKFAARNAGYDVAAVTPTFSASVFSEWNVRHADAAGTTNDPKLVVIYGTNALRFNTLRPRAFAPGNAR